MWIFGMLLMQLGPGPIWPDEDLLVYEVRWQQYQLCEGLLVGNRADRLYLPLGDILRLLEYQIEVDVAAGTAHGSVNQPTETFEMDLARGRIAVAGKPITFQADEVIWCKDAVYVEAGWLSQLIPVDFRDHPLDSFLSVHPRATFPLERKLKRLAQRARLGERTDEPTQIAAPAVANHLRFADWPFLQLSLDSYYNERLSPALQPGLNLMGVGDLGWMTSEFSVTASPGTSEGSGLDGITLRMGRKSAEGHLLGPLRATQFEVGDIISPNRAFVGRGTQGMGFSISNEALDRPREFDRVDLQGVLTPGWEVELYRDGVLIDFREAGVSHYRFEDLPLYYGQNTFRLVFYGPRGEQREEVESFPVDSQLLKPGKWLYRMTVNQEERSILPTRSEQGNSPSRFFIDLERGIGRKVSLRTHLTRLNVQDVWHNYIGAGLRGVMGAFTYDTNLVADHRGGHMGELRLQGGLGGLRVNGRHLRFHEFSSEMVGEMGMQQQSEIRLSARRRGVMPFSYSLNINQHRLMTGRQERSIGTQIALNRSNVNASHALSWRSVTEPEAGTTEALSGAVLVNRRQARWRLRGRLTYGIQPTFALTATSAESSLNLGPESSLRMALRQSYGSLAELRTSASFNHKFHRFLLGAGLTHSDRAGLGLSLSLSTQLAREPRTGRWQMKAEGLMGSPAVSARVFVDLDGNNRFDEGETPLEGVRLEADGVALNARTNHRGIAFLSELPVHRRFQVSVIPDSLDDPFLVPKRPVLSGLSRPGRTLIMDFPMVPSGEIEGMVSHHIGPEKRGISGVFVQLVDLRGKVVATTRTEYDGFFLFEKVALGEYHVQVDGNQLRKYGRKVPQPQAVTLIDAGQIITGIDWVLQPTVAD